MITFKNLITDCVWKVARNLIRDYSELELLQSNSRNDKFVERSIFRAKEIFNKELKNFKFASIQFIDSFKPIDNDGVHVLICPIDGIANLMKAFPFFCSIIVQIKRQEGKNIITACLLPFPALGQIFFAENGHGAWMEKYEDSGRALGRRLRVSSVKDLGSSISSKLFVQKMDITSPSREFGSLGYDIAAYASGKLDAILIQAGDTVHRYAAEIFAKEAGGVIRLHDDGALIATNSLLASIIK